MSNDLTALAVLLVLLVLALTAPRWGADTRVPREWSSHDPDHDADHDADHDPDPASRAPRAPR